jgi:peptide/nickel transport system substrate-binding protein
MSDSEFFAALNRREVSFWLLATGCATGDAAELFESSFHSPDARDGFGIDNYGDYRNPDLDRAIEAAAALASPRARQRALQQLMRTAMEELPWLPLYYEDALYVVDRRFEFSPRNDLQVRAADIRPRS